jgi:uncharacterized membrane protein
MHSASLFQLAPAVQFHLLAASTAILLGPLALRSRKGSPWHRSLGYAWVLSMLLAALSSLFIRDFRLPNLAGYTPIHLLTLATFIGTGAGLYLIVVRRNISAHRQTMLRTYLGGCVLAGAFTLLPGRYLGDLLWHHALGLI